VGREARTPWPTLPIALGVCACLGVGAASAARYEGAMLLGSQTYGVVVEVSSNAPGSIHMDVVVRQAASPFVSVTAEFSARGGSLTAGGHEYPIPEQLASAWWRQLTEANAPQPRPGFEKTSMAPNRLQTRDVEVLGPGIAGKAEIQIPSPCRKPCRPEMVRLFSLEEWNNSFHDRVSLGLERKDRAVEERR